MIRKVQDIIPGDRRSIRNLPLKKDLTLKNSSKKATSEGSSSSRPSAKEKVREIPIHRIKTEPVQEAPFIPERKKNKKSTPRQWKWGILTLGVVVIVAGIGFVATQYFSRAIFTIVPKIVPISVNGTYVTQSTADTGGITYSLMAIHASASSTVPATTGSSISTKAQGTVTLYNAFSAQAQRIVAGTRIVDDSGRIYRLMSSVSVPGYSSKLGVTTPGSISTTIIADQAGDTYNITSADSVSDFKIISYKGTPRYTTIYARIASPISGGFIGSKKIITPNVTASTTAVLQTQLTSQLALQAMSLVPSGYIMYPNSYVTSFSKPTITDAGQNSAIMSVEGTMYVILFNKTDLASHLSSPTTTASFGKFAYTTPGLESLNVSIINAKDFSPTTKGPVIIRVVGNMKLVATVPVDELKNKFTGVPLSDTQAILKPYDAILGDGSSGEVTPPWAKVPSDPSRISIVVQGQ